jgi:DNA-nicking Smr family endonuclease
MDSGIQELDLHGCNTYQAKIAVDAALRRAKGGTYRIRVIHGSNRGTALRDMIRREYARNPKVLRLEIGLNAGITDLVLREF